MLPFADHKAQATTMQLADFATPQFYADPYPVYAKIRAAGELVSLAPGMSVTGHHKLVNALLCDRRVGRAYLAGVKLRYGEEASHGAAFQAWSRMMLLMNPPAHTPVRAALMRAFNAGQMERLQGLVHAAADELVSSFQHLGQADLMEDFAIPLPMRVICNLLDVPITDAPIFAEAAQILLQTLELTPMSDQQREAANEAALRMQDYFGQVVERRKVSPGDDLISRLLAAEIDGEQLSDDDLVANVMLLFMAGHETTASMIGNALIALHRNPDQWKKLRSRPELLQSAVQECLRFDTSVQLGMRVALEDVEIHGHFIPTGHIVYLLIGAANRDPLIFTSPDTLDIERREETSRMVTFGGGVHYCLGARLAQYELKIALKTLIERLPDLELQDLENLAWHQRHTLRGVARLAANWTAT